MSTNRCRRNRNTNWRLVVLIGMENWNGPFPSFDCHRRPDCNRCCCGSTAKHISLDDPLTKNGERVILCVALRA